jgi:hypothetical protein
MNSDLNRFVCETRNRFGTVDVDWRKSLFPQLSGEEWLDTASLAGMSLADLIHAVRFGSISEADIDPQVIEAFHLQYPYAGNFVDFIQSHEDPDELRGAFSGIKGKLFELQHVDYLNHGHLPDGFVARLAESSVQPGYDIIIEGPDHETAHVLQDKTTASAELIREALRRYPNIDIYVPHQTATDLHGAGFHDHIFDSGIDGDALHEKAQAAVTAADHVDGYHFPGFGEILVVATEGYHLHKGKTTLRQFGKRTWRRGSRLFGAHLIGHAVSMATGMSALHAVSIPVRWTFSRWDHAHDFAAATEARLQRIRGISAVMSTETPPARENVRRLAWVSLLGERIPFSRTPGSSSSLDSVT